MSKRMSKSQREEAEKAALRRRLLDIAYGAFGPYIPPDFDKPDEIGSMASELGLDGFARWLGGIENVFLKPAEKQTLTEMRYLDRYDTLDLATAFLWESGIRA